MPEPFGPRNRGQSAASPTPLKTIAAAIPIFIIAEYTAARRAFRTCQNEDAMRIYVLARLLWVPLVLSAQENPNPAALDPLREQLLRVNLNPATDLSDSAARSREALRLPLNADPNASLAEIQAAQTALTRLNDRLNADAERAAIADLLNNSITATPLVSRPHPAPKSVRPALPVGTTQNLALAKPTRQSSLRYFGSRGGADGRVTGSFGFYTQIELNPWWDVDLQQSSKITEVRIYNSKIYPERASTLQVLLSNDGATWKRVYSHNGSAFGADGQPLRVPLNGVSARWVRVQLAETNFLHLDEIEVY